MAFYAVLTYILFPVIAYFLFGKTLEAAGNGFIVGSVVSVVLWRMVGMGMVRGRKAFVGMYDTSTTINDA